MPLRILIIDDSPAMRNFIRRALTLSGLDGAGIFEAGGGYEAIEKLKREPADVVLTDINMPDGDGPTFVREFRKIAEFAEVPVIAVSTDATECRVR